MAPIMPVLKRFYKSALSFALLFSAASAADISTASIGSVFLGNITAQQSPSASDNAVSSLLKPRGLPVGVDLSLLAVGDSITVGVGSSDQNGYRLYLRRLLQAGKRSFSAHWCMQNPADLLRWPECKLPWLSSQRREQR
jgi:opacity protein-like surface antigen